MVSTNIVVALSAYSASTILHRIAPEFLVYKSFWTTVFAVFFALWIPKFIWQWQIYPKFLSPIRHLPTVPGGTFLLGQLPRIIREPSGTPQLEWMQKIPNEGLIRYFTIFNMDRVLVTTPKALGEVLTLKSYDFIKPPQIRESLGRLLGIGILFAEGEDHKRQRKGLAPAFHFRNIKNLYPVFWDKAREMVLAMDKTIPFSPNEKVSETIEVGVWTSRATLDVIGVAGFARSFGAIDNPSNELNQTYSSIFTESRPGRILGILGFFVPFWFVRSIPIKQNRVISHASGYIRQVCRDMVHQKRKEVTESKDKENDSNDLDILSIAIRSGQFTDENLVDQLMTFLAAGHETTASALQWAVYLLCKHPDVQKRLRNELSDAQAQGKLPGIRDSSASATSDDIEALPYLSAVCNEVLRIFPPVPFTFRIAGRDTSILGTAIPKGTVVIISPYAVNRFKPLWGEDAEEFNPDRWMKPGTANSGGAESNYAFLTFLHGPRSCIGQKFAQAEFMCLLAGWVMAFSTELEDKKYEAEMAGGITIKPKGGLKVKLTTT